MREQFRDKIDPPPHPHFLPISPKEAAEKPQLLRNDNEQPMISNMPASYAHKAATG